MMRQSVVQQNRSACSQFRAGVGTIVLAVEVVALRKGSSGYYGIE